MVTENDVPRMQLDDLPEELNHITGSIVDAAFKVHAALGPGLLEKVYHLCFAHELRKRGHAVQTEALAPVIYDGARIEAGYRIDVLVDSQVIVEVKCVQALDDVHHAQLMTYLRLSGCRLGLLINFNSHILRKGIRRVVLTTR